VTTASTHQTEIIADPEVPLIRVTRRFDAPAAKLFRAHAEPDLVARWLGPRGAETRIDHWDCRTGGSYRYMVRGERTHGFRGCFHEVRPSALIVQTFTWEEEPDGVALERLVFEDLGADGSRLAATSLVDSFAGRDAFLAGGMEDGLRECYERLDEVLAG
jgi:uncharacterized protein YndB with AHSA1/START domain